MQQATIVVSYSEQVFFFVIRRRGILSLQIVRNWLACLESFLLELLSLQIVMWVDCRA